MIQQVDLQLSELISNINDISQAKIDNITDEISDIMSHAANTLGMVHPQVSKATKYKMSKKSDFLYALNARFLAFFISLQPPLALSNRFNLL